MTTALRRARSCLFAVRGTSGLIVCVAPAGIEKRRLASLTALACVRLPSEVALRPIVPVHAPPAAFRQRRRTRARPRRTAMRLCETVRAEGGTMAEGSPDSVGGVRLVPPGGAGGSVPTGGAGGSVPTTASGQVTV